MDWGDSSSGNEILLVVTREQSEGDKFYGYFSSFEAVKNWLKKRGFSRVVTIHGETNFLKKFPPPFILNNTSPFALLTDEQEKQAVYVYKMCRFDETTLPA